MEKAVETYLREQVRKAGGLALPYSSADTRRKLPEWVGSKYEYLIHTEIQI